MSKNKNQEEKIEMTEWQKRNLEFLKKKEEEKSEKQKLQEKLRARYKTHLSNDDQEDISDKAKDKGKKTLNKDESSQKTRISEEKALKKVQKAKDKAKSKSEQTPIQKAIKKSRHRAFSILFIAGLVLLVSIFLATPFSKDKSIAVTGLTNTTKADVLESAGILNSDYIFSLIFNKKTYEHSVVANDKWVKKASLNYQFPNKFTLSVKEYGVIGYTQTDNGYQPILEDGSRAGALGKSSLPDSFLTINLTSKKDIQTLVKSLSKLDKNLVNQIQIISSAHSATTSDLLTLEMHDGNTVRVPLSEITKKLPYYTQIKENLTETSIVDMEVGIYTTTGTIESEASASQASKASESKSTTSSSQASSTTTKTETSSDQTYTTSTQSTEKNSS